MVADPDGPPGAERRLALLDSLRHSERRAAVSRVASIIGHLIGTPLHVIAGRAALIRTNPSAESTIENARRIEEQVERLALRIRRLIDYLTSPEPQSEARGLAAVIEDALSLYTPIALQRGVALHAPSSLPEVTVDGTSTLIVLTSLLSLAARVAPPDKAVELEVISSDLGPVVLQLTVPGLAPLNARIDALDPPDREGDANAEHLQVLSVCYAIARRSAAKLEVSAEDSRAVIRLECPEVMPGSRAKNGSFGT